MKTARLHCLAALFSLALALTFSPNALAQNGTWIISGGGSWTNIANWLGSVVAAGANSNANFATRDIPAGTNFVTLDVARTIGSLTFADTNTTTAGDWQLNTGSGGSLTLAATNASPTINVSNRTATIGALVVGTNGYTKSGLGTLVLTNAGNTVTGAVFVTSGVLEITTSSRIGGTGAGSGDITLNGGTFQNDDTSAGNSLVTANRNFIIGASGGTINLPTASQILIYSGILSGSGTLTKAGPGELRLTNSVANSFAKLIISGGTFTVGQTSTGGSDATCGAVPASFTADAITIQSGATNRNALSSTLTLNTNRGITLGTGGGVFRMDSGGGMTIPTLISGAGSLTKVGANTLTLSSNNIYTGGTIINPSGGTLGLTVGGSVGCIRGTVVVNTNSVLLSQAADSLGYGAGTCVTNLTILGSVIHQTANNLSVWGETVTMNGGTLSATNSSSSASIDFGNGTTIATIATNTASTIGGTRVRLRQTTTTFTVPRGTATSDLNITAPIGINEVSPAGLTKAGSGIMTLSGANTYNGPTTITGGTLALSGSGSIASSPTINVASGTVFDVSALTTTFALQASQTLSGSGTVNGNVTALAGATITPGGAGATGNLSFNDSLSLAGNTLIFDMTPATNDVMFVGGNLALSGVTQIFINGTPTNNAYTIIRYNGLLAGGPANFQLNSSRASLDFSVPGQIRVVYTGAPVTLTWRGDGSGNKWDTGTSRSWWNGTGLDWFYNGDSVTFDDSATNLTVTLSGTPAPSSILVNAATNYTWTGSLAINNTLTKTNTGTLKLQTYTGSTAVASYDFAINQGTVEFATGYFNSSPFGFRALNIAVNSGGGLRLSASHALGGDNIDSGTSWGQVRVLGGSLEALGDEYVSGGTVGTEGRLVLQGATVFGTGGLRSVDGNSVITILASAVPTTLSLGAGVQIRGTLTLEVADGAAPSDLIATNGFVVQTTGGLTKTGLGTALLLSTNTYTGTTTISAGTLALGGAGAISNSPTISIASGATFDVSNVSGGLTLNTNQTLTGGGTVQGNFATSGNGSALTPGGTSTAGTLTFNSNLNVNNAAALNFNLSSTAASGNDLIAVGGDLNLAGVSTINVSLLNSALDTTAPYRLITYAGALTGNALNLTLAGLSALTNNYTFTLDFTTTNEIRLVVSGTASSLVWQGTNGNAWNAGITANWSNTVSAAAQNFYNLDTVVFDDTSTNQSVSLTGALLPNAVTVNSASNYTFSGTGSISGTAGITAQGTGTLTINTTNDFTGPVKITNGTVRMGNSLALGSTNSVATFTNGGTLDLGGIAGGTFKPVTVSGSGVGGQGAIVSSAQIPTPFVGLRNVTLAGDTVLGTLTTNRWDIGNNVTSGGGIITGSGYNLTLVGTNDLSFNGLGDTDLGDVVISNRTLFLQGNTTLGRTNNTAIVNAGSSLTLFGVTQPQTKLLNLNGGTLALGSGSGTWSNNISLSADSSISVASGLTLNLVSPISGTANLSKIGLGTLTLSGNNSYVGDTYVTNGFITLATNSALGQSRLVIGTTGVTTAATNRVNFATGVTITNEIVINGGTPVSGNGFLVGPVGTASATLSGPVNINAPPPAGGHINAGNTTGGLIFTGPITTGGTATSINQRLGRVTLAGGGSYPAWIFTDLLVLGANDGISTACTLQPGGSGAGTFDMNGFNQTLAGLTVFSAAFACVVTNSSTNFDSTLTIASGTSTYTGTIKDGPRKIALNVASGSFTLTNVANNFSGDINVNSGGTLSAWGNNNVNPVVNSPLGAANLATRTINVNSGGTLAFIADNTLGNAAAVPALTLAINGGNVNNTATNFTTLGPLTFNNGGTLTAFGGNSVGFQAYFLRGGVTVTGSSPASITASGANSGLHLSSPTVFNVLDVAGGPDLSLSGNLLNQTTTQGGAAGSVVKIGPGTMQLSGVQTYTGSTLINEGTLSLASGSIASLLINVASNATFDVSALAAFAPTSGQTVGGSGIIAGTTLAGSGSTVSPGGAGVRGTLSITTDLALSNGAAATFDLSTATTSGGGTNDLIVVGNNLNLEAGAKIILTPTPLSAGTYSLINYAGSLSGGAANLTLVNGTRATAGLDSSTANWITLVVTNGGTSANLVWRGGLNGNVWDINTTTNWDNTGTPDLFYQLDNVTFDDVGATNPTVSLVGALQATSVTMNSSSNYLFTGTGKLTGPAGITKSGTGTLTIASTNDFTGAVLLNNGVLSISNLALNGSVSPLGAGTDIVFDGGTLQYIGTNTVPASTFNRRFVLNGGGGTVDQSSTVGSFMFISNTIAGPGSLTKIGAKQLIVGEVSGGVPIAGNNTFDGITYINNGEIQMRHPNALGSLVGKTVVNTGGDLAAGGGWTNTVMENIDLSGDGLSGGGALLENDTGTAVTFGGNVTLVANASIGGVTTLPISGPIGGTGRLMKVGGNTAILTGNNTYNGGTLITNGTLQLDNNSASGTLGTGPVSMTAGNLSLYRSDAYTLTNSVSGAGAINVRCTNGLTLDGSAPVDITGSLSVGQTSYGRLVVSPGANASVGSFYLGNPTSIPGDVVQTGGAITVGGDMRVGHWSGETSSYLLGGGSLALTNFPAGSVNAGTERSGVLYIGVDGTGSFTQTGGVASANAIVLDHRGDTAGNDTFTLDGGTFTIGANGILSGGSGANASYIVNLGGGTLAASTNWSSPLAMTLTGVSGDATLDTAGGNITLSGSLTGPGGLIKNSTNTLTISGNNAFGGAVTVNAGALSVANNNALGSTSAGTTVNSGAEVRWGNGTFTLAEPLTLNGSGAFAGSGALRGTGSSSATWNGNVSLAGNTTIKTDGTATVALNGNVTGVGTDLALQVDGSGNNPINGPISLGAGSFTKASTGKVTLSSAANSWIGSTFVNGGTLALSGSGNVSGLNVVVASGATLDATARTDKTLTLASGQTLSGNGTVAGFLIASPGSFVAPGLSVGRLTVSSNVTLSGTVAMEIDKAGVTNDILASLSSLTYGGTLAVTNISATPYAAGDSFKLFSATNYVGSFTSIQPAIPAPGLGWDISGLTNGTLSIVRTIPTSPTNITFVVNGSNLELSWPSDYIGWRLETNSVDLSNTNFWFTLTSATTTNFISIPFDLTVTNVFYRMAYP